MFFLDGLGLQAYFPGRMTGRDDHHFASDNTSGICPEAMAAITEANQGRAPSYGDDAHTAKAKDLFRETFETDCEVFFVLTGTASNALSMSGLCKPYQGILCHELAHIETDECGASEFFTGGAKVSAIPGENCKLDAPGVEAALLRGEIGRFPRIGTLSLTQSTEWGTLYSPGETRVLADIAHSHGAHVHMDGARFANAAAALKEKGGFSPADVTWRAGVDVLSFGGTKNGMLAAEAVLFFNRDLAAGFGDRMKKGGQLFSKMRYAGAQWAALLEDGLWRRNAAHANAMAKRLAEGLASVPGIRVLLPAEVNAVFAEMAPSTASALMGRGWRFHPFIGDNGYRLMCSWDTRREDLDAFLADVRAIG
jgi:threonine aldolase